MNEAVTYDRIQQRSIHNAYLSPIALMDQLVYYRVRNFELDLRADDPFHPGNASDVNDWHVWHMAAERGRGRLSDYLKLFRAYHDAVPEHEVVTLTLELKGNDLASSHFAFDPRGRFRTPAGLDARLAEHLGRDNLFTPADLLRRCPGARTLAEAVERCGWPTVDELRGKFVVTVHEYNFFPGVLAGPPPRPWVEWRSQSMWQYAGFDGEHAARRVGFIAPLFLWESDQKLLQVPWAVFHTEVKGEDGRRRARAMRADPRFARMILRSSDNGDASDFAGSQRARLNALLTDHVDWHAAPWARTHNRTLYPFAPLGVVGDDAWTRPHALAEHRERQHLLELSVRSGDIDGTSDDFVFAHVHDRTPARTVWSAFVSVASNDEVHRHAKGCLMARASADPAAAFFAVARHGDDEQLQVHYRLRRGAGTEFRAAHFPYAGEGLHGEDATFVRMILTPTSSGGMRAEAQGSLDQHRWHRLAEPVEFPAWLELQGIGACSNDPRRRTRDGHDTRLLFGNLRKDDRPLRAAALHVTPIGEVPAHRLVDHSAGVR